jgi:hypothetical protein
MRNQSLALAGTALAVFGLVCPASFVLGVELLVAAALWSQFSRARLEWHLPRQIGTPVLSA